MLTNILLYNYNLILKIKHNKQMPTQQPSPPCFYHPSQPITYICLHTDCILPLCQQCLPIHRKQLPNPKHLTRIIPLKQAKNIAIASLTTQYDNQQKKYQIFVQKINQFKIDLLTTIQNIIDRLQLQLKCQIYQFQQSEKYFKNKIDKIQCNHLKQLIKYYQLGNTLINQPELFTYNIKTEQLTRNINTYIEITQEQPLPQANNQTVKKTPKQRQNTMEHSLTLSNKKRYTRPGIFVASSPSHMKKFGKYHSIEGKTSIKSNPSEIVNEQVNTSRVQTTLTKPKLQANPSVHHLTQPLNPHPSPSPSTSTSPSPNPPTLSKTLIFPKRLIITRQPPSNLSTTKPLKKSSNWKDVINKQDIASNSRSSSRLMTNKKQNDHINCLTPLEMRQLIKKKIGNKISMNFGQLNHQENFDSYKKKY